MYQLVRAVVMIATAVIFAFGGATVITFNSDGLYTPGQILNNALGIFSVGMAGLTLLIGVLDRSHADDSPKPAQTA